MFETADPVGAPPTCPEGFKPANTPNRLYAYYDKKTGDKYLTECLKVRTSSKRVLLRES